MLRAPIRSGWLFVCLGVAIGLPVRSAFAQTTPAPEPAPAAQAAPAYDPERRPDLAEPDFRLINLPSNLRLPRHRSNFTITHRFNGNLRDGSFLDQLSDLFGLDRGANIGLEYRFAVLRHVQAVVFRTNIDKALQFSARFDQIRQSATIPISISPIVTVEGSNNFRERRHPGVGVVLGRSFGTRLAVYATPMWVGNTAAQAGLDMDTSFIGIAGRARIRNLIYVTAEVTPRLTGYKIGEALYGFAIERRIGGHVFQLNFTNGSSTTFGQIARGGFPDTLSMGFNISRKFF